MTTTAPVIGTGDACLTRVGPGLVTLGSAARTLEVRADDEVAAELHRLIDQVLPLFAFPAAPGELDPGDLELYDKYRELIERLDLVRTPRSEVLERMVSPAHSGLYRYLARHSSEPDEHFLAVLDRSVVLHGPTAYVRRLGRIVAEQGLAVQVGQDWRPGDPLPQPAPGENGVTVMVAMQAGASVADWRAVNQAHQNSGRLWAPVLVTPADVRLGPWTAPGESACPTCLERGGTTNSGSPAVVGSSSVGAAWSAWATTQAAMLHWTGGVLAHLLLRIAAPTGPNHPWGSVFTLDADRMRQESVRVWRDPACPDCGVTGLRTPAWRDL
ncbi:hypothetical protein GCM10022223_69800 [Kineosporia mesophila]|uniref:Bacteriocin biosynthesis cyclodehydratase domain-containing protein n=1 Tax=Kineosporia mesophila TaxID=566012 RepID=A0ABP7AU05_9ACTN|nr:TOMM precursor leader peptide-binding protein [Kineosporia mesophila]MCD5352332.1 TOMM precursor leader peptide-binding protein [Kineosporia mesophila]